MSHTTQQRLAARYGTADIEVPGNWNPLLDQLLEHRSVRAFTDAPLPEGTLQALVAAAQSASTSSNLQVWSVVAVEDPERKARLSHLAGNQAYIRQAPLFLVWLADLSRASRVSERAGVEPQALPYLESLLLGTIDAALAAQNAVVALESLGLGTVYIGGIRNDIASVATELDLPPQVYPVFGLCVGYPDREREAQVKPRLPQAAVLHRETYQLDTEEQVIAQYDSHLGEFYRREGMKAGGWSEQVVSRLSRVENLHGREALLSELTKMGFGLR